MARGVGGTTSVSSGFWGLMGPRWRTEGIGGNGAPPSSLAFEERFRADGAGVPFEKRLRQDSVFAE